MPLTPENTKVLIQTRSWKTGQGYRGISMTLGVQASGETLTALQSALKKQIRERIGEIAELPVEAQDLQIRQPSPWHLRLQAWWAERAGTLHLTQFTRAGTGTPDPQGGLPA